MSTKSTIAYDGEEDRWHLYRELMDYDPNSMWLQLEQDLAEFESWKGGCKVRIPDQVANAIHAEVERRREDERNWATPSWVRERIEEAERHYGEYLVRKETGKLRQLDEFMFDRYPEYIAELETKYAKAQEELSYAQYLEALEASDQYEEDLEEGTLEICE